jgi:hypothetical protein
MKTLRISISEVEFNKFGFNTNELAFSDLVEVVSNELLKQRLKNSLKLAKQFNLAEMTIEEISAEVNAVRNDD